MLAVTDQVTRDLHWVPRYDSESGGHMAQKLRRPARRTKTTRRSRSSKPTTRAADLEALADTENDIDGCTVDFTQGVITEDAELPPARGGVETVRTPRRRTAKRR
jgi:hypothetical protein